MLADQSWEPEFTMPEVMKDGVRVPSQPEKEASNLNLDWRKRVSFTAELEPMSMNRFDCRLTVLPEQPRPQFNHDAAGNSLFDNGTLRLVNNKDTGRVDSYRVNGVELLAHGAFSLETVPDSHDLSMMAAPRFTGLGDIS